MSEHIRVHPNKRSEPQRKPQTAASKSEASGAQRRYGRIRDVEQMFSLGRTTIYNLLKSRRIASVAISVTGKRCRARLVDLDSVKAFIESQTSSGRSIQ